MPLIARTFIKTGFIYFMLSLTVSVVMQVDAINFPAAAPLFWHMLMVGWITQIIFGVSMWLFPGRKREESFTKQLWGWLTYLLLNTGLVLRVVAEPWIHYSPSPAWDWLTIISAVTQLLAAICYTVEMWPRVMSKKQRLRKNKQKRNR